MSYSITLLTERRVFAVSGKDAGSFLQGLVTADIEPLGTGHATHTGLLTPQGKIMFDFFVIATNDGYLVDAAAAQTDDIIKRLSFYKLRADVEITPLANKKVAGVWGEYLEIESADWVFEDPRFEKMGWRVIAEENVLKALENTNFAAYENHRIKLGIPDTKDIGSSQTFPHEANFDQLGGVSFTKGCYVGQEVVSRMQHRGTARSRIVKVSFDGEIDQNTPDLTADGKKIGQILSTTGQNGLALVRLDRASSAIEKGTAITAGTTPIKLVRPQWASFKMAEN